MKSRLYYERERVERLGGFFLRHPPQALLAERRQRLDMAAEALDRGMRRALLEKQYAFQVAAEKLEMLNPLHVIRRGYSVVEKNGAAVRSIKELAAGDEVLVRLADGSFDAAVGDLREGGL